MTKFDPKEELRKMAIGIIDESHSQFHDYCDMKPGKQWSISEKIELRKHLMECIIEEIKKWR